jgi:hypothetical protein
VRSQLSDFPTSCVVKVNQQTEHFTESPTILLSTDECPANCSPSSTLPCLTSAWPCRHRSRLSVILQPIRVVGGCNMAATVAVHVSNLKHLSRLPLWFKRHVILASPTSGSLLLRSLGTHYSCSLFNLVPKNIL